MKGLLLKDWYLCWKYCRIMLFVVIIFSIYAVIPGNTSYFPLMYGSFFMGMIPSTLYAYDERERWIGYSATLPVSRAQVVSVKYILSLLTCAASVLLHALILGVRALLRPGELSIGYSLNLLGVVIILCLLFPAVSMPSVFRLGTEKGRIFRLIIAVVIAALGGGLFAFSLNYEHGLTHFLQSGRVTILAAVLFVTALFALSWRLSIAFYRRREL